MALGHEVKLLLQSANIDIWQDQNNIGMIHSLDIAAVLDNQMSQVHDATGLSQYEQA